MSDFHTGILHIMGREILDSRGTPTVEAVVTLKNGLSARAAVPSGASTGSHEAVELRDGEENRYFGKGVTEAIGNINAVIAPVLKGLPVSDIARIDRHLLELDGTEDKSKLGANAMLAVSLACARAGALLTGQPLYRYLGGARATTMPMPMMNVLNGGAHADNALDVQEFMIVPIGAKSFAEAIRSCAEVYHALKTVLQQDGQVTAVGDEGGFAPNLRQDGEALDYLMTAVSSAGYQAGRDFAFALDAAASEWQAGAGGYRLPAAGEVYTSDELIDRWQKLIDRYPICSLEDPLGEEDWQGWQRLTERLGDRLQLVGDDLFVTKTERLRQGIESDCANAILIKPNQVGTLSETLAAVSLAQEKGYRVVLSHRSGETEDTFLADLAVATCAGQIKTGAPCRGERTAKYNRLLRIASVNFGGHLAAPFPC